MIFRLMQERLGRLTRSRLFSRLLWKDISDDYARVLSLVVGGWLNPGNLLCFDHAIRNLPSTAPIVEIGSFCGLSANLLTYYKRQHRVRNPLICCDSWTLGDGGVSLGASGLKSGDVAAFVRDAYVRGINAFSQWDLPYGVERFSHDFFESWGRREVVNDVLGRPVHLGGNISFCFIDGDHGYETAKQDFENCRRFLESGRFVLFDDSSVFSSWAGVRKVVEEVKSLGEFEIVMKNPNYLFRKK